MAARHLLAHLFQLRILHVLSEVTEFHDFQLFGMEQVLEKQKLPLRQLLQPDFTPFLSKKCVRPVRLGSLLTMDTLSDFGAAYVWSSEFGRNVQTKTTYRESCRYFGNIDRDEHPPGV